MLQGKFIDGKLVNSIGDWVNHHETDYKAVMDRLSKVRDIVLHGDIDNAASILKKAYVFSVMSIRTEKGRHERAFTAHYAGDLSLKKAFLQTVYGGQKYRWVSQSLDSDWVSIAQALRAHVRKGRYGELLDSIESNLVGVAHRKGAFMLAMCGLWEYMCIDSNVARYGGFKESDSGESLSFDSAKAYFNACGRIIEQTGIDSHPPFIVQWAIYDYERGEHARHMAFFREVLAV